MIGLLKLYEREEHLRAFVAGQLYMNSLAHFRCVEDPHQQARNDPHEGVAAVNQLGDIREISIAGRHFRVVDQGGPARLTFDDILSWKISCMTGLQLAVDARGRFIDSPADARERLRVPERMRAMGANLATVTNVSEFIHRVRRACEAQHLELHWGPVSYYDPTTHSDGDFERSLRRALFRKSQEYAYQREFRLAANPHPESTEPFVLDVGDLSDIVLACATKDFDTLLEVQVRA